LSVRWNHLSRKQTEALKISTAFLHEDEERKDCWAEHRLNPERLRAIRHSAEGKSQKSISSIEWEHCELIAQTPKPIQRVRISIGQNSLDGELRRTESAETYRDGQSPLEKSHKK
jgi:hypothetical protein